MKARKKIITLVTVCAMALTAIFSLTGCTGSDPGKESEKAAVCYVIGNTANSQGLNLNSPLVQDTIYDTVRNYGYISVVNVDASPDIVFADSFDIDAKYKRAAKDKLDMDARSKTSNLITNMKNVIAVDEEVDYFEALRLAVRSMASLEGYDSKTVVVIGTGLSTTGVLSFQRNLISAEPDTIVELLREKEEIPSFDGITVHWLQMGDTAAPQQALSAAQRNKLKKIYQAVIEAGGGTCVYNESVSNPVNEDATYPSVTPVELPAETPITFDSEAEDLTDPVVLTEEQITFIGDKAEYLHPEEAERVLKPIADFLLSNDVTILLCGTTAGDNDNAYTRDLSKARAETVKQSLIDLGVEPSRVIAVGLGSADPWHVYGIPTSDKAASCNRKVVLLDAASQTAQEVLAGLNE